MLSLLKRVALLAAPVLVLLALASPASATVNSTNITTPSNNSPFVWLDDTGSGSITVAGTADATDGDQVDIYCYKGNNATLLVSNVTINGGAFSTTQPLDNISAKTCVLRAVPAGTTPTYPAETGPFAGPSVLVSYVSETDRSNTDFYVEADQRRGFFGYDSAGWCGVDYSAVVTPELGDTYTNYFYDCNQWAWATNYDSSASAIKVDGQNAYLPGAIPTSTPGFVRPTIAYQFSGANDLTITETDKLFVCPGETRLGSYPYVSCPAAVDSGIRLDRSIVQGREGLQTRVTDNWVNTTGAQHAFSIAYEQDLDDSVDLSFPNGTNVTNGSNGQSVAGKFPDASSIGIAVTGAADNDPAHARGAITMFPGADSTTIGADDYFFNNYATTIAAGSTYIVDAMLSQSTSQGEVNQLAADAAKALTPQPTFGTATKAKATYNKKTKKITLTTGQSVNCPARGQACAITGKLTTKIKVPPKKSKKKSKKKAKAKYKTYTIGTVAITAQPGTTTPVTLKLSKKIAGLLVKQKKLKITSPIGVTAGSLASASQSTTFTVKAPKIPKPKKHKHKRKH